jgi:pimeloyl-ACP methyl ester carboxylesterase
MIRLTEAQVRAYLRRVVCPVLLVRPRDGWPVPDRAVSERLDCLRRVELVQVEGGHHVHLVDPGHVAGVVGGFLRA